MCKKSMNIDLQKHKPREQTQENFPFQVQFLVIISPLSNITILEREAFIVHDLGPSLFPVNTIQ